MFVCIGASHLGGVVLDTSGIGAPLDAFRGHEKLRIAAILDTKGTR